MVLKITLLIIIPLHETNLFATNRPQLINSSIPCSSMYLALAFCLFLDFVGAVSYYAKKYPATIVYAGGLSPIRNAQQHFSHF